MSQQDSGVREGRRLAGLDEIEPTPRRINVAANRDMLAALDRVIDREQVTLTEAARRLIAYGDLVYGVTRVDGACLVIRDDRGSERDVVVL